MGFLFRNGDDAMENLTIGRFFWTPDTAITPVKKMVVPRLDKSS